MQKTICMLIASALIFPLQSFANDLNAALENAKSICLKISTSAQDLKQKSAINTAITGAGTITAGAALYTGIRKADIDKQVQKLDEKLNAIDNLSNEDFMNLLQEMANIEDAINDYQSICTRKKELTEQSKNLGNIRTGLMAANTVTAIAGTAISATNKNTINDIKTDIEQCIEAINKLNFFSVQAKISQDIETHNKLNKIITACSDLERINLEKTEKHNKTSMITSAINIGTGTLGTITSAVANSNKIRNGNSDKNQETEKNLNTTANISAGLSTVASGISTVFNATTNKQAKEINQAISNCQEALNQ
ncbi:MAG: hypothetical protein IKL14_04275 [Alphaproteobacteria bacterium]|nr:hypothetical protein [Alphaproteobacteria bacterium]